MPAFEITAFNCRVWMKLVVDAEHSRDAARLFREYLASARHQSRELAEMMRFGDPDELPELIRDHYRYEFDLGAIVQLPRPRRAPARPTILSEGTNGQLNE